MISYPLGPVHVLKMAKSKGKIMTNAATLHEVLTTDEAATIVKKAADKSSLELIDTETAGN